ncbi:MAG: prepilin-type N-terminal cleavage/methylation domain-containing protein [Thermoguttaceae bacterium]
MNRKLNKRNHRGGFTLVEMLVVLLIIVILAGLITAAAYRGLKRAKVARIGMEIQQISLALEQYKQQFGEYPPDFSDLSVTGKNLILRHIARAFPHYTVSTWNNLQSEVLTNSNSLTNLNNMTPAMALVFWLGGMPDLQGKLSGFSKNPADPFESPSTTASRIGPFFEFDPSRLSSYKYYPSGVSTSAGQPYIYFRAESGYSESYREYYTYSSSYTLKTITLSSTTVRPYWDARVKTWVNPSSFQILCCGLDGKFSQENVYNTGRTPATTDIPNSNIISSDITGVTSGNFDYLDDQTNFTTGTIGDDLP